MGCYAEIVHHWPDGSRTECEVSTDQDAHPDLLDEMVKRVLELYRSTVVGDGADEEG